MRLAIALCLAALAAPAAAQETTRAYDLLFREGTLDTLAEDATLLYDRSIINAADPEAATRDTGRIALAVEEATGSDPEMANILFRQDDASRSLGAFPASIGNPMIMYFMETTARDMGATAGGSPFYIRNRLKESLLAEVEVQTGKAEFGGETVETQTVVLEPFADDPNRDRMRGFGAMTLTVTMSEDVPGWYASMVAEAAPEGGDPIYRSALEFEGLGSEGDE